MTAEVPDGMPGRAAATLIRAIGLDRAGMILAYFVMPSSLTLMAA